MKPTKRKLQHAILLAALICVVYLLKFSDDFQNKTVMRWAQTDGMYD